MSRRVPILLRASARAGHLVFRSTMHASDMDVAVVEAWMLTDPPPRIQPAFIAQRRSPPIFFSASHPRASCGERAHPRGFWSVKFLRLVAPYFLRPPAAYLARLWGSFYGGNVSE